METQTVKINYKDFLKMEYEKSNQLNRALKQPDLIHQLINHNDNKYYSDILKNRYYDLKHNITRFN